MAAAATMVASVHASSISDIRFHAQKQFDSGSYIKSKEVFHCAGHCRGKLVTLLFFIIFFKNFARRNVSAGYLLL